MRIGGRSLDAAVPAEVVRVAVAVLLAVGLVVLLEVGVQVGERESVVRGDEVHARGRTAARRPVEIAAAGEPRRELRQRAVVAAPEPPRGVAVASVPFAPAGGEVADAIAVRAD